MLTQYSLESSAALVFLIITTKMQAAVSFLHISLPKLVEDNIPPDTQYSRWLYWRWNHFNNFIFLFSLKRVHDWNFSTQYTRGRKLIIQTSETAHSRLLTESYHCYAEWAASIYICRFINGIFKIFCFVLLVIFILHIPKNKCLGQV